jgi:hypothetical protein
VGAGLALCLLATVLEGATLKDGLLASPALINFLGMQIAPAKYRYEAALWGSPYFKYIFDLGSYRGPLSTETALAPYSEEAIVERPLVQLIGAVFGALFMVVPSVLVAVLLGGYVGKKVAPRSPQTALNATHGFALPAQALVLMAGLRFVFIRVGVPQVALPQVKLQDLGEGATACYLEVSDSAFRTLEAYVVDGSPYRMLTPKLYRRTYDPSFLSLLPIRKRFEAVSRRLFRK